MSLPLVSIVIPSYKAAHFEQCLRSAIGQTYPRIEILVSDNCPTEAIRDICAKYPQVIYQRNTAIRDKNVLGSFFSGKGDLIKPLFDDDILHPFCVERMVATMNMDPGVQLVFSASQVINVDNERTETRRPYEVSGSMSGRDMQRSMVIGMRNVIGEFSSIMFRRDRLWEIGTKGLFHYGAWDCTFGLADVAAYFNLAQDGTVFYIDEELSYFRHDQRLESNSNPSVNPNFGYCFSDYIDLAVESQLAGVISNEELVALRDTVDGVAARLSGVFPMVATSQQRYHDHIAALG
ncbi:MULTISPECIES: glycosyltransferase family A protein [unclassified Duganella]|jgi:glycosyltransferase involved in cell wall biosynthesis|uniref:glycosyltransferase family 2 protein n=1 Tax=unclassified Duganella TaxID=2636909 RepID=UPI0008890E1E|nr:MULTISPECIES: glycosyltransferase family A protein [unclassified Duganella]SDH50118.1 Glycosyl transferase family 2 [Duganella sp. OV458]SDK63293.1 Glycosyl transferase family 2 [Duganella sp. OV510]